MSSPAKSILTKIPAREWRGLCPEWAGGRLNIALTCSKCGGEDHWSAAQMVGPQTAVPKVIKLGWTVGKKLICPKCVMRKDRAGEMKDEPMNNVSKLPNAALIGDSKKNKRLVIVALEDYYDEQKNCYREGKSDKTVATELNLSPGFVANVREEFYGKMVEPSEVTELRGEVDAARKLIDDLHLKLTGLCTRNGWKV